MLFLGKNELQICSAEIPGSSSNPVIPHTDLAHSFHEKTLVPTEGVTTSAVYCSPTIWGFHLKTEWAMCCHSASLQMNRWMCTTVQWVPPRHRNVLWGLGCGQLEGKMGNWRHKLHPCGKTGTSSSVGGLKGYGGAAHRFFFCVNTNWCHLETVKKIKQLYRSSWATNKIWWTKGRFVFLPSTIPPIQTREKKKLRTISRVERQ